MQTRLIKKKVEYSLGPYNEVRGDSQAIRITEGCPHDCPFCYEPKKNKIFGTPRIIRNHVLIYDMNLLSKPQAFEILKMLPDKLSGKKIEYEMVCGVDYRFLTQEIAEILKKKNFKKIRIAWDMFYSDQYAIKKAIYKLNKAGYKSENVMVFMICNWRIPFEENCKKLDLCKIWNVQVADCYYDNQTFPNVQPEHWTYQECKQFRKKCRTHNQLVNFKIDPSVTLRGVFH